VKVSVIATVLGTVLTYISLAVAQNWPPFTSSGPTPRPTASSTLSLSTSPSPSPQGLTVEKVKAALLMPSDLNSIDANLLAQDISPSSSDSCSKDTVNHTISVARDFKDGGILELVEFIEVFNSSGDADVALKEDAQQFTCSFTSLRSSSNISSKLSGLCDEGAAAGVIFVNHNSVNVSAYIGEIRCGRILLAFSVDTAEGSSLDSPDNLVTALKAAIPNVKALT
jgi:hypothetical protein